MHSLRGWGLALLILSPIAIISPFLIVPIFDVPFLGPLSSYPNFPYDGFLIGVIL